MQKLLDLLRFKQIYLHYGIMGIIFIIFAELWHAFFQIFAELWVPNLSHNVTSPYNIRLS